MGRRSCWTATRWKPRVNGSRHVTTWRKSRTSKNDQNQPNRSRRTKPRMLRQSLIAFSIVLVAASGTLAKKETAIPTAATKQKQLALVRVNVTGQSYDYFRPWQKKAPMASTRLRTSSSITGTMAVLFWKNELIGNRNSIASPRVSTNSASPDWFDRS